MKALINFSVINGKVNINGACLYSEGRTQRGICNMTDAGYKSNKPLFCEFITIEKISNRNGKSYIALTENEYVELSKLPNPSDPNKKVWNKWKGDDKATVILEICKRMSDPYDRG